MYLQNLGPNCPSIGKRNFRRSAVPALFPVTPFTAIELPDELCLSVYAAGSRACSMLHSQLGDIVLFNFRVYFGSLWLAST